MIFFYFLIFIHKIVDASSINLTLPFSDESIGRARQAIVPGDGACFFHATGITREAFKERILAIKHGKFHTSNVDLQAYAAGNDETSAIFNGNAWAEYESNRPIPAQHFTDAEALAFAFDIHIEIYERGEEDPSRAALSAVYNENGSVKKKLLISYTTGENLASSMRPGFVVQIPGHFDKLYDITYLDTGWQSSINKKKSGTTSTYGRRFMAC